MKKLLLIVAAFLMASGAMAKTVCIQDGYLVMGPEGNCPGEYVQIKKITKTDTVNKASCDLEVVEWKGKTYVNQWSCIGSNTQPLKKSLEKQYLGLSTKIVGRKGNPVILNSFWGSP